MGDGVHADRQPADTERLGAVPGRGAIARVAAACIAAILIAGCGEGDDDRLRADTEFRRALESVGAAASPLGNGFGWLDVEHLREQAGPAEVRADARALGPGGDQLFREARRVERETGIDPLAARRALSLSGSYTFAVRLDGVAPGRLGRELRRGGARRREIGDWAGFDLGLPGRAVTAGPLSVLDAFVARTAIDRASVVLSRMDGPRASLTGAGGSVLDHGPLDFATACLGEVSAARTFPGGFAYNRRAAPDLVAVGLRPPQDGPRTEVLCAIDDSAADSKQRADAVEGVFAEGAEDPVTGEPVTSVVETAEIDMVEQGDLHAARVEVTLKSAAREGLLFAALNRGSVFTYTGSPAPVPNGE